MSLALNEINQQKNRHSKSVEGYKNLFDIVEILKKMVDSIPSSIENPFANPIEVVVGKLGAKTILTWLQSGIETQKGFKQNKIPSFVSQEQEIFNIINEFKIMIEKFELEFPDSKLVDI